MSEKQKTILVAPLVIATGYVEDGRVMCLWYDAPPAINNSERGFWCALDKADIKEGDILKVSCELYDAPPLRGIIGEVYEVFKHWKETRK